MVRVPSEGARFEVKGVHFEVKKSRGMNVVAEGYSDQVVLFNSNEFFQLYGSKCRIQGCKIKNKKTTLYFRAVAS